MPGELTIHGVTRSVECSGRIGVPGPALLTGLHQVTGAVLVVSPEILLDNLSFFGETPTLAEFLLAIPIGTVAYTGIETISNMAGEARDEGTTIPGAIKRVMIAVLAISSRCHSSRSRRCR